jgi:hypothetical protein
MKRSTKLAERHRRCQAERCNRFFSTNAYVQAFGARSFQVARALCRRPQFALKPSQGIRRSHWVDQHDRDLVDEIASGTFEGPNLRTGGAWRDARQRRCYPACRTRWSLNGHETRLNPAGARYSQSPIGADAGGDGPSWNRELCRHQSILTTIQITARYPKHDLSQIDSFFIGRVRNSERTRAISPDFTTAGSRWSSKSADCPSGAPQLARQHACRFVRPSSCAPRHSFDKRLT